VRDGESEIMHKYDGWCESKEAEHIQKVCEMSGSRIDKGDRMSERRDRAEEKGSGVDDRVGREEKREKRIQKCNAPSMRRAGCLPMEA
jgi:hypothetical protein